MFDLIPDEEQLAEANKRYPADHEVDDPHGETGVALSDPAPTDDEADDLHLLLAKMWGNYSSARVADAVLAAGFRRVSPVTREVLADAIEAAGTDWNYRLSENLPTRPLADEVADAVFDLLSVSPPAEDEWEYGLRKPFDAVPRMTGSESLMVRMQKIHGGEIFKRTAPGDWIPVKGTEQ